MKNRLAVLLILTLLVCAVVASRGHGRVIAFHHDHVLGTSLDLQVVGVSDAAAARADRAVLAQIGRDAVVLSGYDSTSEFSRWLATSGRPTPVSDELFEVLGLFDTWRERTGGALDASAETVSRVWKAAAAERRMPSATELASAVASVQRQHWRLDSRAHTATRTSDAALMLNSFAKSYIVDRAARAALATSGVRAVVVNIGGDLVVRGAWSETVGVMDPEIGADNAPPLATLSIRDRAVATSGGYRRGYDIDGHHYSHIIDPRTGVPAGDVLSATVVAPNAVDAGALATAFCVLRREESIRLAASVPGVEFLIVAKDGSRTESAGWRGLVQQPIRSPIANPVATASAAEQAAWDPTFELVVTLEVARPGGQSRRPYVAVWIEDKDRFPVRTLALWYEKPKWLPDLKAWYRGDRVRAMAEGTNVAQSISSATRAPGTYTLKWDGKDNQGKLVKPGLYTVCIEAAREHGTYQVMRQEMEFSGAARKVDVAGNAEIANAALDYRKIGPR